MRKDPDYEIVFWKDWLDGDFLKRRELVENLPLFGMCLNLKKTKMWKDMFANLINGYFEDLEAAVYTKMRLEDKKKKK